MAKYRNKRKEDSESESGSRKCIKDKDDKWYCYKKIAGGRWEECIPRIAYDTVSECMNNEDC